MRKYTKKIRKILEDPKSEICFGKELKKKKVDKPYKLLYRYPIMDGWNPKDAGKWRVYRSFAKREDRDHEFEKGKRSFKFWEWDIHDEFDGAYGVTGNTPDCESVIESSSLSGHPKFK